MRKAIEGFVPLMSPFIIDLINNKKKRQALLPTFGEMAGLPPREQMRQIAEQIQ